MPGTACFFQGLCKRGKTEQGGYFVAAFSLSCKPAFPAYMGKKPVFSRLSTALAGTVGAPKALLNWKHTQQSVSSRNLLHHDVVPMIHEVPGARE